MAKFLDFPTTKEELQKYTPTERIEIKNRVLEIQDFIVDMLLSSRYLESLLDGIEIQEKPKWIQEYLQKKNICSIDTREYTREWVEGERNHLEGVVVPIFRKHSREFYRAMEKMDI